MKFKIIICLTKKYKISHLNAHRALADAAVTKELFFIYEDAQTVARPNQSLDDFEKILNKVKLYKSKKVLLHPVSYHLDHLLESCDLVWPNGKVQGL